MKKEYHTSLEINKSIKDHTSRNYPVANQRLTNIIQQSDFEQVVEKNEKKYLAI